MTYYTGNQTGNEASIGLLPAPYYWWEAGGMWGTMVQYCTFLKEATIGGVLTDVAQRITRRTRVT
jgi:mannan endo-1,6-alpha-mannosidase